MGYRKWRQNWCKITGNKVLGKKNETKILCLAHVNVTVPKEVLDLGFLSHFSFPKTLFPSFVHHFASNSYTPPTFSLENVFLYLLNFVDDVYLDIV